MNAMDKRNRDIQAALYESSISLGGDDGGSGSDGDGDGDRTSKQSDASKGEFMDEKIGFENDQKSQKYPNQNPITSDDVLITFMQAEVAASKKTH
ncbi:unnamed protein product [Acanthocheilonema viteae]|uniref:Uncharacterized protein n=1 Tax=Acanthocheilonema viteae TaxID=6277 RepID=A0A498SIX5_ACAVI|nr:unnamed protein product [Acanthocheilonema viteae]